MGVGSASVSVVTIDQLLILSGQEQCNKTTEVKFMALWVIRQDRKGQQEGEEWMDTVNATHL